MLVMGLVAEVDEETVSGDGESAGVDECRERKVAKQVAGSEGNKVRRAVPATAILRDIGVDNGALRCGASAIGWRYPANAGVKGGRYDGSGK